MGAEQGAFSDNRDQHLNMAGQVVVLLACNTLVIHVGFELAAPNERFGAAGQLLRVEKAREVELAAIV